jgi:hypothetical protein
MKAKISVKGISVAGSKVGEVTLDIEYGVDELIAMMDAYPKVIEAAVKAMNSACA